MKLTKEFLMMRGDNSSQPRLRAAVDADQLTISIYGDIGESMWGDGVTPQDIAAALQTKSSRVTVRINSPGGSAFDGVAIYNLLTGDSRPVDVIIDGLAASAASIIAMAGDTIRMGTGTMLMIHPASVLAYGTDRELVEIAATLTKLSDSMADIYSARSGVDKDTVLEMMYAETWMTVDDAIQNGFATDSTTEQGTADEIAADFDLSVYDKVPESLKAVIKTSVEDGAHQVTADAGDPAPQPVVEGTPNADLAAQELRLFG